MLNGLSSRSVMHSMTSHVNRNTHEQAKKTLQEFSVYTWTSRLREGWEVWGSLQGRSPAGGGAEESDPAAHLFLGAWVVRGGVTGRPEFTPPYWYFAFFSDGFRIWKTRLLLILKLWQHVKQEQCGRTRNTGPSTWKEHIRDSSTLIIPPALSNSPQ